MWLLVVFFFFPCMPLVFQAEICTELNGTLQSCKRLSWGLQSAAKFLIPEEVAVASLALVEWVEMMLGFLVCGAEIMYITLTTTLGFWVTVAAATSSSITAGRVGLSCSTVSNFVVIASSIIVFFCWSISFEIGQYYDYLLWIDSLPFRHLKSSTTESNDLFMAMTAMFTKVAFLNCNTYLSSCTNPSEVTYFMSVWVPCEWWEAGISWYSFD